MFRRNFLTTGLFLPVLINLDKTLMRVEEFKPVFVKYVPENIDEGVLYISEEFGTVVHLCACGCGFKTAIPIKPLFESGWDIENNDDVVTLSPSLLHRLPCASHYFIRKNKVEWS